MAVGDGQKRVKTGCLTCRTRRRKCDEGKPDCGNCLSKSLNCQYRTELTFVASKFQDNASASEPKRFRGNHSLHDNVLGSADPSRARRTTQPLPVGDYDQQNWLGSEPSPAPSTIPSAHGNRPQTALSTARSVHEQPERDVGRKSYELELLAYFRYNVAPILDLGLDPLFGVGALVESSRSESTYNAILALAASQRGSVSAATRERDLATGTASSYSAEDASEGQAAMHGYFEPLRYWRQVFLTRVDQWRTVNVSAIVRSTERTTNLTEWLVLARLYFAIRIDAAPSTEALTLSDSPAVGIKGPNHTALSQLAGSFVILGQILAQGYTGATSSRQLSSIPAAQWHCHWKKVQEWYLQRTHEMKQIFELPTSEEAARKDSSHGGNFPRIVFMSHCAVVANVAHHMSSVLLLQKKPRLLRFGAESNSSTSSLWHLSRAIGIVIEAAGAGLWDVFTTSVLLLCTRSLSSVKQIESVRSCLQHIQKASGLLLENSISQLQRHQSFNQRDS